jgi:hypothetical protein
MTEYFAQDLDDLHRREIENSRKAFAAGNEAGLYDALVYCKRNSQADMIDMERAEMVMECRERKAPWRETYKAASQMLKGTEVEGGPGAIEGTGGFSKCKNPPSGKGRRDPGNADGSRREDRSREEGTGRSHPETDR